MSLPEDAQTLLVLVYLLGVATPFVLCFIAQRVQARHRHKRLRRHWNKRSI